jgi:DNA replication licensing factor MCM6
MLGASLPRVADQVGEAVQQVFADFIENFVPSSTLMESDAPNPTSEMDIDLSGLTNIQSKPYLRQIMEMKATEKTTLIVDFSHFFQWNDRMATIVQEHFVRLEPFLRRSIQDIVKKFATSYLFKSNGTNFTVAPSNMGSTMDVDGNQLASGAMRDFWISFYNMPKISRYYEVSSRTQLIIVNI